MITKLLVEFVRNVLWGDLDYLVIDMPPGTGDAQLTICQQVPLSGGVIVTTPQEVALLDVKRGVTMFREVNVPVLGVVENMSYHICRKCGTKHDLFGSGGRRAYGAALRDSVPRLIAAGERGSRGRRPWRADRGRRPSASAHSGIHRDRQTSGIRDTARRGAGRVGPLANPTAGCRSHIINIGSTVILNKFRARHIAQVTFASREGTELLIRLLFWSPVTGLGE